MDAAALDELEGAGQVKRMVARLCAEIHNATRLAAWSKYAKEGEKPPELMHESQFLPVKVVRKQADALAENRKLQADENLRMAMNAMCGF